MLILQLTLIIKVLVSALPSHFQSENVLNGTSEKPFIFFHIPKTGGTTAKGFLYDQLFMQLNKPFFFPNYGDVPAAIHEPEVTKIERYRNILDCSVAIISHFSPKDLGISFLTNTLGIYGLSACAKKWWDNSLISEYINIPDFEMNVSHKISDVRDEIRYGNNTIKLLLKKIITKERDLINFDKLAVDVVKNSNCMIIFREPITRMWSWYHFFKFPRFSKINFYEYLNTYGLEGMYNLTGKNIQSTVVGDKNSLLRETIFNHCYIGVQEHYYKVKEFLYSLHPVLNSSQPKSENHDYFVHNQLSASNKTMKEKLDDFPIDLRNEALANLLKEDAKLWKRAYYHVTMENSSIKSTHGCEWCVKFWENIV